MSGYSGTPLVKKLGIKSGSRVALLHPPRGFALDFAPVDRRLTTSSLDVMLAFYTKLGPMEKEFESLKEHLATDGGLWIAWPKKSSGVKRELHENIIRNVGLQYGLVDNKVCAIDETWSGLRFVRRLSDR